MNRAFLPRLAARVWGRQRAKKLETVVQLPLARTTVSSSAGIFLPRGLAPPVLVEAAFGETRYAVPWTQIDRKGMGLLTLWQIGS